MRSKERVATLNWSPGSCGLEYRLVEIPDAVRGKDRSVKTEQCTTILALASIAELISYRSIRCSLCDFRRPVFLCLGHHLVQFSCILFFGLQWR